MGLRQAHLQMHTAYCLHNVLLVRHRQMQAREVPVVTCTELWKGRLMSQPHSPVHAVVVTILVFVKWALLRRLMAL